MRQKEPSSGKQVYCPAERDQPESGEGESMNETLSEAGEGMEVRNAPDGGELTGSLPPAPHVSYYKN